MKVWIKAGVIIFYVLIYSFLRKRMRRDFIKFFKAMMLLMIFILSLDIMDGWHRGGRCLG